MKQQQFPMDPNESALIAWKKLPLDEQLQDWVNLNTSLFNLDCGLAVLSFSSYVCSGFFRLVSMGALVGTLGSRANLANQQQLKLEYLYTLYKNDISDLWQDVNQTSVSAVASTAASGFNALNNLASRFTGSSPAPINVAEPQSLRILKVIGFYLPPEKVAVWKCKPEFLPPNYKEVINLLGIYPNNSLEESQQLTMKPVRTFQANNVTYLYHQPEAVDKQFTNNARYYVYGLNSAVSSVLSPVGTMAQTFMKGASSFFGKKVDEAVPNILDTAKKINNVNNKLRLELNK